MPLGVTPLALLLWYPFAFFAQESLSVANTLWVSFSCAVFAFSALELCVWFLEKRRSAFSFFFVLLCVVLCSHTLLSAVLLGQTSLLGLGALLLLFLEEQRASEEGRELQLSLVLILFFALALKPTYLLLAAGFLFCFGYFRALGLSLSFLFVLLLFLLPRFGMRGGFDYLHSLAVYTQAIPIYYQDSIVPHTMNIFRTAFAPLLGEVVAARLSSLFFSLGVFGVFCLRLFSQQSPRFLVLLLFFIFLVFAPYLGAYEELFVLGAFVLFLADERTPNLSLRTACYPLALILLLNHNLLSPTKPLLVFLVFKAALLLSFLLFFKKSAK